MIDPLLCGKGLVVAARSFATVGILTPFSHRKCVCEDESIEQQPLLVTELMAIVQRIHAINEFRIAQRIMAGVPSDERWQIWDSVQHLHVECAFARHINHLGLPTYLQNLTFGARFDTYLNSIVFPLQLRRISFGAAFNQRLDIVRLPSALQELHFGESFKVPLNTVLLPNSLLTSTFDDSDFDQPLDNVQWPTCLRKLVLD